MSTVISKNMQVGTSGTPAQNFTLYQPATPDGTVRLANGNSGSTTDLLTMTAAGNLGLGVTPSAWSQGRAMEFIDPGYGLWNGSGSPASMYMLANAYFNGGFKYGGTGQASHYYQYQGAHVWSTAASGTAGNAISFTQAMTLDASGNLGVGTTSPAATYSRNVQIDGSASAGLRFTSTSYTAGFDVVLSAGDAYLLNRNNTALIFSTNATERARIDSSGNLLVGTTSAGGGLGTNSAFVAAYGPVFKSTGGTSFEAGDFWNTATTGDNYFVYWRTEAGGTVRGSVNYNRGAGLTAYNTTSDYRAKDIIGPLTDSGAVIDSVPVYMGKMKGATQERPMFIAHETPAYAHTGEKDAVDADGNPVYQQMDASALVPVMWAEIQSLRQRLAAAGI